MSSNQMDLEKTTKMLRSFWQIQRNFAKWAQESIKNSDLSMPQFWILQSLFSGEMIPQKAIGEKMLFPKSTLSSSIDGLVESGLVKRIILEENRREVQLQITKEGEQKVHQFHEDPNGLFQRLATVLAELPPESIDSLFKLHEQLYDLMIERNET